MGRDEETKAWEGTPNATAEDGKAQEPVIEMRDIVKRFGDFVANDHVQLKLHKGEVLAILGENGSRKVHPDEYPLRHASPKLRRNSGSWTKGRDGQPGKRLFPWESVWCISTLC